MSKNKPALLELRGRVVSLNISPRGTTEGAILQTPSGVVQINFPKHEASALTQTMCVGADVVLATERESDHGDHPVYVAADALAEARGTIVRFNYALHGAVNGYHLDDKTFLHVKPEGAKKQKLCVGEKVRAIGSRRVGADAIVLEVREIARISKRPANEPED